MVMSVAMSQDKSLIAMFEDKNNTTFFATVPKELTSKSPQKLKLHNNLLWRVFCGVDPRDNSGVLTVTVKPGPDYKSGNRPFLIFV